MKTSLSALRTASRPRNERWDPVLFYSGQDPASVSGALRMILLALLAVLLACTAARSEEKAILGEGLALKMDYIDFTDGFLSNNGLDKSVYVGLEAYAHVAQPIYLGVEAGVANPSGTVGGQRTELTYVPIELNVKYVNEFMPGTNFSVGGGMSANHVSETVVSAGNVFSDNAWLLGGQIFSELLFSSGNFFAGFNVKYQFTDNMVGADGAVPAHRFSNWRLGGLGGFYF